MPLAARFCHPSGRVRIRRLPGPAKNFVSGNEPDWPGPRIANGPGARRGESRYRSPGTGFKVPGRSLSATQQLPSASCLTQPCPLSPDPDTVPRYPSPFREDSKRVPNKDKIRAAGGVSRRAAVEYYF
jgi:hypothetical protein